MLHLSRLKASSVRLFDSFDIQIAPKINYFFGANASGKTSVLETIYLLSRVKSFRSSRINNVIKRGDKTLSVYAEGSNSQQQFRAGLEKGYGVLQLKYNNEAVLTASEQAKLFPVFLLAPDHNMLFYSGPKQRRHWLDWSLFHVEQHYLDAWKKYFKAVRQRNSLLKRFPDISSSQIKGWELLIAEGAKRIDEIRQEYIQQLNSLMNESFLPKVLHEKTSIDYTNSMFGEELLRQLIQNRADDANKGYTSIGPHRAEIVFRYSDTDIAKLMSRGQIKLYGAALISAQIELLKMHNIGAILLVDDVDAELDIESTEKVMRLFKENNIQTFISSLSKTNNLTLENHEDALFHVEQGKVERIG